MAQKNLFRNRYRLTDIKNRSVVAMKQEEGKGWTGNWGLVDENYYL